MSIILRTSNIIISGTTNLTLEKIKTIDTGEHNTLFLSEYGRVYGCGNNRYGQLGSTINNDTDIANPVPTLITETIGSLNITGISTGGIYGGDHSLFLTHDGKVYGCGHNGSGQLGKAVSNINPVPTQITTTIGSLNIVQVACGGGASLFLTDGGRVYSCGYNRYGNLGLIDNIWIHDPLITPKLVIDINGVSFSTLFISKIRASSQETFFITNNGQVYACGYNWHGQLGHTGSNGSYDYNPNIPRRVMSSFYVVDGAPNNSSYFLTNTGKVYSCGANDHAQLGWGGAGALINANPGQITANNFGTLNIIKVVCGSWGGRFLASDGKLYGVGYNADGRMGLSNTTHPIGSPTQIAGALSSLFVSDVFGYGLYCNFNYVITTNNNIQSIYNFGNNRYGQLGRTTNNDTDTITNTSTLLPIERSLPTAGQISLSNIQTIMGGTNPITLSEYYQNATSSFTSGISDIPNINSLIRLNLFRGKNKAAIIVQSGGTILPQSIANTNDLFLSFPHNGSQYTIQCLRTITAQLLVVAGGGSGGRNDRADNRGGGGGGAGGLIYMQNYILAAGTYTIIVGNGGTRGSSRGNNGGNSSFGTIVATGGGGGGGANVNTAGSNGGSGGGGGDYGGGGGAGTGTANQGFNGGNSDPNSGYGGGGGGGGGGSASVGESSPSSGYIYGLGGNGRSINITGTSTTYAKGGNGGPWYGGGDATNATANLGNGGDGARFANAGNGGSGIVIIRYNNN
jgi:alpha-tubulin suppressor-like RCC1 family protein